MKNQFYELLQSASYQFKIGDFNGANHLRCGSKVFFLEIAEESQNKFWLKFLCDGKVIFVFFNCHFSVFEKVYQHVYFKTCAKLEE